MVKTIRIEDENIHRKLVKLQGKFMSETGDSMKLEEVVDYYNRKNPKRKSK